MGKGSSGGRNADGAGSRIYGMGGCRGEGVDGRQGERESLVKGGIGRLFFWESNGGASAAPTKIEHPIWLAKSQKPETIATVADKASAGCAG